MALRFVDYIHHGWKLIPLVTGDKSVKQRGWNTLELALSEPADVEGVESAGLAHAYSGTCAIDIDDFKHAQKYLRPHGINLKELYNAPDVVRIASGRKNRAKLIYQMPEVLASMKIIDAVDGIQTNIVDFRCGTATGATVQDALPPSVHPDTGRQYKWSYGDELVGDWRNLPDLPQEIFTFWSDQIHERNTEKEGTQSEYESSELAQLIEDLDPDCDYNQWLKIGMALHNATGGSREGIEIWDSWSSNGKKYVGKRDLVPHWRSFRGSGITIDYLIMHQVAKPDVFDDMTSESETKVEKKSKRFQTILIGKWVNRPPPKWIIHGVLPQADLAMILGAPSSGKSFFGLDIAMTISLNHKWRGLETVGGPVIWIAAEAVGSVRNRGLAYAQFNDVDIEDANLHIIGDTPNLSSVEDVKAIMTSVHKIKPVLVVIDTLSSASGGSNENSGQDMGIILAACRSIHKVGKCLILLIHHTGKDVSRGSRGWSGIKGAMQTEIEIIHTPTGERIGKVIKQRDGEQDAEFPFRLTSITLRDHDGIPQNSCAVEPEEFVTVYETEIEPDWGDSAVEAMFDKGVSSMHSSGIIRHVDEWSLDAGEENAEEQQLTDYLARSLKLSVTNRGVSINATLDIDEKL